MDIIVKDELRESVEAASGGKQTVLRTAKGQATYMNIIPRVNLEDLHPSLGCGPHPAFVVNGIEKREIMIGTYQAVIRDGEALSLPGHAPAGNINFDAARAACLAAGSGFHLLTNYEWSLVALWCSAEGYSPRGNTRNGDSHSNPDEKGTRTGVGGITITGSGPASWRHDGTMFGISDLVGNVWEWVDGLKLSGGKVVMTMDNAFAAAECEWTDTGAVVNKGGALQIAGKITKRGWLSGAFREISGSHGFEDAKFLKQALLLPIEGLDQAGHCWADNTEDFEALPFRGGCWSSESNAGLAALYLDCERSFSYPALGFRPAFIG